MRALYVTYSTQINAMLCAMLHDSRAESLNTIRAPSSRSSHVKKCLHIQPLSLRKSWFLFSSSCSVRPRSHNLRLTWARRRLYCRGVPLTHFFDLRHDLGYPERLRYYIVLHLSVSRCANNFTKQTMFLTMPATSSVCICSALAFAVTPMIGTCLAKLPTLLEMRSSSQLEETPEQSQ